MSFNFLLNKFPQTVIVNNVEYKINFDFKIIIGILLLFDSDTFLESEKKMLALSNFYIDTIPIDESEAINEMFNFIHCYEDEQDNKSNSNINREIAFDFEIDSMDIFSAFFQIYNIDLSLETMHWFKFIALFRNLNSGTPLIVNKMQIRTTSLEDLDDKTRMKYIKLKKEFSVNKKTQSFGEHQNLLANSFMLLGGE